MIFICYRRSDTDADAGRLYDGLAARYGDDQVFKDVDDIPLGSNFRDAIDGAIGKSDLLLVLVGPDWYRRDTDGQPMIMREGDFVRLEIEAGLNQSKRVIPLTFRGARMPTREELPETCREFADLHAAEIDHSTWQRDTAPVVDAVDQILAGLEPTPRDRSLDPVAQDGANTTDGGGTTAGLVRRLSPSTRVGRTSVAMGTAALLLAGVIALVALIRSEDPVGVRVGLAYDVGSPRLQALNESAVLGAGRAETDLGAAVTEVMTEDDDSDRAEKLQLRADESDIVIGVGFLFAGATRQVASENPATDFVVIDDPMVDFENGGVPWAQNVAGITFAEEEGSFLVGVIAALKSETGRIGFIGGVCCFGVVERFEAGYLAGAKSVDPDVQIVSTYLTTFPDLDGFAALELAKEAGQTMFEDGVDIVYHAAGESGVGLFDSAREHSETSGSKVWAIGLDIDEYHTVDRELQDYILTSMIKRYDTVVFDAAEAQKTGAFVAGNTVYGLAAEGLDYSTSGGFVDDIVGVVEEWKNKIASGEVTVPAER